jgi:hypothetical protein
MMQLTVGEDIIRRPRCGQCREAFASESTMQTPREHTWLVASLIDWNFFDKNSPQFLAQTANPLIKCFGGDASAEFLHLQLLLQLKKSGVLRKIVAEQNV